MKNIIANWGLYPSVECDSFKPNNYEEVKKLINDNKQLIARGNGRCYGDASISNKIISSLALNRIIEFNEFTGVISCQSGVLLSTILEYVVPKGYFLPVTPGTKFITVGGAFASDIHGKNHHVDGVFSDHVLEVKIINETGDIITAKPEEELFNQTAGGMGLSGFILEVQFKLKRIETSFIKQTAIRAKNLTEIFSFFEKYNNYTYSVAWIDCFARGKDIGRSVLLLGEHAKFSDLINNKEPLKIHKKPFLNIPFFFPSWILNPLSIKIFNKLFYYKPSSKIDNLITHYDPYFYPLDKINNWNRIYGQSGFIQYQFVIPKKYSYDGVRKILEILSNNNLGSFLAVLKLFGKSHENRFLEFPIEGYTLALDIKISKNLLNILDRLDEIVTSYGGKIYLTKDARMSKMNYDLQYPNQIPKSNKFVSHQSVRLSQNNHPTFLIIGGNSDIAKATALKFINKYPTGKLLMAVRNIELMQNWIRDNNLTENSKIIYYDVSVSSATDFVKQLTEKPTWIMYAAGVLYSNEECLQDIQKWNEAACVNFTGAVSVLNELINDNNPYLERIIGMSSIAALRGRKSNYIYGSTKAGFHQYLFGLRQELKHRNIRVQAITPGVVKTKMTLHLKMSKLSVNSKVVATSIINENSSFEVYPNFKWKIISLLVKYSPEFIINKI